MVSHRKQQKKHRIDLQLTEEFLASEMETFATSTKGAQQP